jgi:hypothetical protein
MANKVTNEDILRINEIYYKTKVYAEVARQTGFAPSTVKKYIIKDWQPVVVENIKRFDMNDLPDFDGFLFRGIINYGNLCVLTEREREEMKELWGELAV